MTETVGNLLKEIMKHNFIEIFFIGTKLDLFSDDNHCKNSLSTFKEKLTMHIPKFNEETMFGLIDAEFAFKCKLFYKYITSYYFSI